MHYSVFSIQHYLNRCMRRSDLRYLLAYVALPQSLSVLTNKIELVSTLMSKIEK